TSGQVTHALLSRPPLTIKASFDRPFDLHVSCTPPALILSQDQTLRKMHSLAAATFVRGFDRSHIRVFWISATLQLSRCSPLRSTRGCSAQKAEYGACILVRQTGPERLRGLRRCPF